MDLRDICHQHGHDSDRHDDGVIGRIIGILGLTMSPSGGCTLPAPSICWHVGQMAAIPVIFVQYKIKQRVSARCESLSWFLPAYHFDPSTLDTLDEEEQPPTSQC